MDGDKDLGYFYSRCCRAPFKWALTDKGEWILRCDKCGRACGFFENSLKR